MESNKPFKDFIAALSPTQYKHYMSKFGNYCVLCNRTGQPVSESLEGKGFFYCEDSKDCSDFRIRPL